MKTNNAKTRKEQTRHAHVADYYWRALVGLTIEKVQEANDKGFAGTMGDMLDDVADAQFADPEFTSAIREEGLDVAMVRGFAREMAYADLKRRGITCRFH